MMDMGLLDKILQKRKKEMKKIFIERQQMMFNFECIGVGKAGIGFLDSLLSIDERWGVNQVYPCALASSRFDYEIVQYLNRDKYLFPLGYGDREVRYAGVGGNQRLGQHIAMQDIHRIIAKIREDTELYQRKIPLKAIVLVGSLGGGTGGGSIPFLAKALKLAFPNLLMIVVGILPNRKEGNVYLVNASRSFRMMWNLMIKEPSYIDTFFLFENPEIKMGEPIQSLLKINHEFATTFNLLFGSGYSPDTLDPQDRVMILNKGRNGISLIRYSKSEANVLTMKGDRDIEAAISDSELMMRENLRLYPPGTVQGAQFAAFQMRSELKYFPWDLKNILIKIIENKLINVELEESIEKKKEGLSSFIPIVKGGFWPLPKSRIIELGTMIVGIDPKKYGYLTKIWDMYEVLYKDTFREDLNEIWNWRQ